MSVVHVPTADGRARASRRRITGRRRHAGEVRLPGRRRLPADRHSWRRRPLPRPSAGRSAASRSRWRWPASAKQNCALPRRCWGFARCPCSTTTTRYLDAVDPRDAVASIVRHLRRVRPDVVVTFGPDGAYGHPDHIAISQFTTAAVVAAADLRVCRRRCTRQPRMRCRSSITWRGRRRPGPPIRRRSGRCAPPSTASNDTPRRGPTGRSPRRSTLATSRSTVCQAIACHESQVAAYERLQHLTPEHHRGGLGLPVVLSRVQHRQRRARPRRRSVRRDCRMTEASRKEAGDGLESPRRSPLAMDAGDVSRARTSAGRSDRGVCSNRCPAVRSPAISRRRPCATRSISTVRCRKQGTDPGAAAGADRAAAVRSLAVQRAPALLRLHHRVAGADRHARRPARGGGQPERRRLDAGAGGHRDRVADGPLDRGADRLPGRLRRAAGQRRQHGQHRLLPGGARRQGRHGTCGRRASPADAGRRLRVYASAETHTWIQKAADLAGLGTDAIRWIPTDAALRMDVAALRRQIEADVAAGDVPCLVVGTAGSVSTGAVDPLPAIAAVCREHGVWFHVDGAYGGFAAAVPEAPDDLRGLEPGRFGRGRSAQVALRAARGRLRAGARSGSAARRVLVSPALLPLRGAARPTTSTTVRRTRAASARSRCGWRCGRSARPATAG